MRNLGMKAHILAERTLLLSQHRRSVPSEAAAHRVANVGKLSSYDNIVAGSLFFKASPLEAPDIAFNSCTDNQHRTAQSSEKRVLPTSKASCPP